MLESLILALLTLLLGGATVLMVGVYIQARRDLQGQTCTRRDPTQIDLRAYRQEGIAEFTRHLQGQISTWHGCAVDDPVDEARYLGAARLAEELVDCLDESSGSSPSSEEKKVLELQ